MGGSGGSLGSFISGTGSAEEVLLRIRHGALESSVNLLLKQEASGVDRADEEINDPRLEVIRLALLDELGELDLRLLGSFDVLVVFTTKSVPERPPNEVIARMVAVLEGLKTRESDMDVYRESFQIIVAYTDGVRCRLTPAIKTGNGLSIPSSDSSSWVPLGDR